MDLAELRSAEELLESGLTDPSPHNRREIEDLLSQLYASINKPAPEVLWVASPMGLYWASAGLAIANPSISEQIMNAHEYRTWQARALLSDEQTALSDRMSEAAERLNNLMGVDDLVRRDIRSSAQVLGAHLERFEHFIEDGVRTLSPRGPYRHLKGFCEVQAKVLKRLGLDPDDYSEGCPAALLRTIFDGGLEWGSIGGSKDEDRGALSWFCMVLEHGLQHPYVELSRRGLVWTPFEDIVVCSERSSIARALDERNRPHSEEGPVANYSDGYRLFALHGVTVPEYLVVSKDLSPTGIVAEPNAEVRRVLAERYGYERLLRELDSELIDEGAQGKLWSIDFNDEKLLLLEVENASTEPDGSRKRYFLRVPPNSATAKGAAAWTFGLVEEDYDLLAES